MAVNSAMDEGTPTAEFTILVFDTNIWLSHADSEQRMSFYVFVFFFDLTFSGIRRSLSDLRMAEGRLAV